MFCARLWNALSDPLHFVPLWRY